ncbi:hypothetical protein [Gemmatimonas sp.]|jgi:hypothetical protein|uniref:hypothetical protein n=1 Tax=Gemmatimonas sp. TaxID=1962908 RepID=UPI0022C0ECF9|nr:hypothetical protein [Gemmatimonas sp.]MCZ8205808.1 hypothetical protein [Gemmatimonas sp.]
MAPILRLVAAALVVLPIALSAQPAPSRAAIADLKLSYAVPAGWTAPPESRAVVEPLARVHLYRAGSDRALALVVAGWRDVDALMNAALADLQSLSGAAPAPDGPVTDRRVGRWNGRTASIRLTGVGGVPLRSRIVAFVTEHGSTMALVTVTDATTEAAVQQAAEQLLGSVRAAPVTTDAAAMARVVGRWRWFTSTSGSYGSGGSNAESTLRLDADGRYERRTTSSTYVTGATIAPTDTREAGRWRAVSPRMLLLEPAGGAAELLVYALDGGRLTIDGKRYLPVR